MQTRSVASLEERIAHLERRLFLFGFAFVLTAVALVAAIAVGVAKASPSEANSVLHVKGIVVEDAQGRPRILLGAPVPKVSARKRTDDATGLIVLSENGADRVAVGYPTPAPQSGGKVASRIAAAAGIQIDDPQGDERGGFGFLDNGRVVLGLDYAGREAVTLAVVPEWGFAGVAVNAESGSESERAELAVLKDGTSLMKLADTNGDERAMFLVKGQSVPQLLIIDPKSQSTVDALAKLGH